MLGSADHDTLPPAPRNITADRRYCSGYTAGGVATEQGTGLHCTVGPSAAGPGLGGDRGDDRSHHERGRALPARVEPARLGWTGRAAARRGRRPGAAQRSRAAAPQCTGATAARRRGAATDRSRYQAITVKSAARTQPWPPNTLYSG